MDITIPDISRDSDRGQVGIETLIIFIAMILVAAIAASVLINTAGYLQNQASATSEDSEAQVSNQVLVLSSIGEISSSAEEDAELTLTSGKELQYSASFDTKLQVESSGGESFEFETADTPLSLATGGSGPIELSDDATLTITSEDTDKSTTLTHGDSDVESTLLVEDGYEDANINLNGDDELEYTGSFGTTLAVESSDSGLSKTTWDASTSNSFDLAAQASGALSSTITVSSEKTGNEIDLSYGDTGDSDLRVKQDLGENIVSAINMTVMQSPGANEIDLAGASVEYIGPDGEQTLSYSGSEAPADGQFGVDGTTDTDGTAPVLTSREDRFTMSVDLEGDSSSDLRHLQEGEEATVRIVTQSGSTATAVINVPQSLSSYDSGDAVEL